MRRLERRLQQIATNATVGNTRKLLEDDALLAPKLAEETAELAAEHCTSRVVEEAADLLYFTLVKTVSAGASLADIEAELDRRERVVTRRAMTAEQPG